MKNFNSKKNVVLMAGFFIFIVSQALHANETKIIPVNQIKIIDHDNCTLSYNNKPIANISCYSGSNTHVLKSSGSNFEYDFTRGSHCRRAISIIKSILDEGEVVEIVLSIEKTLFFNEYIGFVQRVGPRSL